MGLLRSALIAVLAAPMLASAAIPRAAEQYRFAMQVVCNEVYGRDCRLATTAAQIRAESNFSPSAISYANAAGLGQFTESTSRGMARLYPQLRPINRFDPMWSIRANALLMRDLLIAHPGFNRCETAALALASYNQGGTWTRRAQKLVPDPRFWFGGAETVNPGKSASNYEQTVEYVRRILLRFEPEFVTARWGRGSCYP